LTYCSICVTVYFGMIKLIGVAGNSCSGKDSFFKALNLLCPENQARFNRVAFADILKSELEELCWREFHIHTTTQDPKEKELIRPLLVAYGVIKRELYQGTYWISKITPSVKNILARGGRVCVTDVRFNYFPEDELKWVKSLGGIVIFLERLDNNGQLVPPANYTETVNNELVMKEADIVFRWPSLPSDEARAEYIRTTLPDLNRKIWYE